MNLRGFLVELWFVRTGGCICVFTPCSSHVRVFDLLIAFMSLLNHRSWHTLTQVPGKKEELHLPRPSFNVVKSTFF